MESLEKIKPTNLWYSIGYITADGNLNSDGRHLNITSKDIRHLQKIKVALKLTNKITMKARGSKLEKRYGALQFGSVEFYRFLSNIGLTPRKSLTLGPLSTPNQYFTDFLRGLIDGDGNIQMWIHPQNNAEQWGLRIASGAPDFAQWIHTEIEKYFRVKGVLIVRKLKPPRNPIYNIKFGKMAAKRILEECYYEGAIALSRKRKLAQLCVNSYPGWTRSFTVEQ